MFGFRLAEIHEEKSDLSEILFLNIKKSSMELFVYCFVFSVCFYFFLNASLPALCRFHSS